MNMKSICPIALSALWMLATGCSNPLDKPFNRETAEADFTRIVKLATIDSADVSTMAAFMVEKDLIGSQVLEIGATYRDILEQAKAEAKDKADQAEAERNRNKAMPVVEDLVSTSLELLPPAITPGTTLATTPVKFRLIMENKSGKRLKAIKGKILIADAFGEPVHTIEYRILDPLEPGERLERLVQVEAKDLSTPTRVLDYQRSVPLSARWESTDFRY